jgi:hypothetical protein
MGKKEILVVLTAILILVVLINVIEKSKITMIYCDFKI